MKKKSDTGLKKSIKAKSPCDLNMRTVLDSALEAVLVVNEEGTFVYGNQKASEITGYEIRELLGKKYQSLGIFPGKDLTHANKYAQQDLEWQSNGLNEIQLTRKDGKKVWVEFHANPVKHDGTVCVTGFFHDISERKQWEEALKESKAFSTKLLENAPNPVLVINPDFSIEYVNMAFEKLSGFTLTEVVGVKIPYPWWPEESRDELSISLKETMARGGRKRERIFQKKDGSRFWVDVCSAPVMANGTMKYFLVDWTDITERKKVEEALRDSEEKFRNLFENAKDAVVLADVQTGTIVDVNPAGCKLLGLPKDKIIGMHQSKMHPPELVEKYKKIFHEHVEKGLVVSEDTVIQCADGSQVQCEVSASVAKSGDRQIIQRVFRDVTERKQAEMLRQESEEKFSKAFHASPDAISISTLKDGTFLEVNDSYVRITGYTREELIGNNAVALNMWATPEQRDRMTKKIREGVRIRKEEYQFRAKSGDIHTMLISTEYVQIGGEPCLLVVCTDVTETRKVSRELLESQEFNTNLLEKAPNQVVVINPDTSIKYVNPSWEKLNGWTKDEVIGLKVPYPWWPEDMKEAFMEPFMEVMKGGDGKGEVVAQKKNGELYWLSMNWTPVKRHGKLMYLLVNSVDITEQKKTEEALKESEEKFSKSFRSSPNSIVISKIKNGELVEVNDTFSKYIGYTREELIGHTMNELKIWEYPKDRRAMLKILKEQGGVSDKEVNFRLKSGEIRTSLFSAEPINIGGEACIIFSSIDITERKKSETLLKTIADSSPIGVYIEQDGAFKYVNRHLVNALGYTLEELMDSPGRQYIFPNDRPMVRENAIAMLKGKLDEPYEYRTVTKAGDIRYVIETVDSITYDGRRAVLGNLIDITERKQMEDELRGHRDNLEELVLERTNELSDTNRRLKHELEEREKAEQELLKAKDDAEMANRAKSEFLTRTSHEIRTPIHGVMGMINLVLDGQLGQEQRQYLKMAMGSAESLLDIINDILDLSKIEAGQVEPEKIEFNLQTTFEDALETMAISAYKKGLEFISRIPRGLPTALVGDEGRLRQILVNLIGNANKFTERGEITLSVDMLSDTSSEVELHFAIRDTGIGIPVEKQNVIFEPFQQADGSINRKYGGTGLGLTISQHLISNMGGRIWVESEPGKGSTFHFTGKFAKQPAKKQDNTHLKIPQALRGAPVLLVDDNASSRQVFKELLSGWDFQVTEAENGMTALAEMKKARKDSRHFRMVFIDRSMPSMSGFDLAGRILHDSVNQPAIVMMLPPDSISNDFHRCQELGISSFVVKPVKELKLYEAVLQAIGMAPKSHKKSHKVIPIVEGPHLHILVAEDNITSQVIARKTLEKMGHTVEIARNGSEATRMVEQGSFDLVLMDAEMPIMNGLEATRYIRKQEKNTERHIPIIAMTAYAMKEDRNQCLEAGMDGYLSKPANPDDINKVIMDLFPQEKESAEPPAVDIDAAMKVFGGDNELLKEAAGIFLEQDYPEQIEIIKDGIKRQDAPSVKAAAHSVKGAARSLGGLVLGEVAFRLEQAGRDGDLANAHGLVEEMEIEVKRFSDFFLVKTKKQQG